MEPVKIPSQEKLRKMSESERDKVINEVALYNRCIEDPQLLAECEENIRLFQEVLDHLKICHENDPADREFMMKIAKILNGGKDVMYVPRSGRDWLNRP